MNLTTKQRAVLNFLRLQIIRSGMPPTRVEIAAHFGFTPNAAECHLQTLARKEVISLDRGKARGIRITAAGYIAGSAT